jgi:hypothetical protein
MGCRLAAQGPPPETQICKGWWQWEKLSSEGTSLGRQGLDKEGLSLADCQEARQEFLAQWKELYPSKSPKATECQCQDTPPPKPPNLDRLREAQRKLRNIKQAVNSTLSAFSDKINDDFHFLVRTGRDLELFISLLRSPEGPKYRSAKYILELGDVYSETNYQGERLETLPDRPLRQIDVFVERILSVLNALERRWAEADRKLKDYYAVAKLWFGVDEDGVLSGPFESEVAVRGGRPERLRFVWYMYRPEEEYPFLFFESKERCEAGQEFWHGTECREAPTTDLEPNAFRRGGRVDFKPDVYEKYKP